MCILWSSPKKLDQTMNDPSKNLSKKPPKWPFFFFGHPNLCSFYIMDAGEIQVLTVDIKP